MELRPIAFKAAKAFIAQHHRHHLPPQGWKFGIALYDGEQLVGVATAGRPVARMLDDGLTLEVTRCCTDGSKNACSMLYGAVRRAAIAMGYRRIITYTLVEESGSSLRAAGWRVIRETKGGEWGCPSRPRGKTAPACPKILWEAC